MRYIADLREGDMLSDIYLCKTKLSAKTKAGKTYYSLLLQDKTGKIDAKIWELSSGIDHFESMDYIKVDGQVTSFQGTNQLNIKRVRKAGEGEYYVSDYMPSTTKNVEDMYQQILAIVGTIKDVYLKELVESFFVEDKDFIDRFKCHSAAKSVHHGFMGGLLEHTLGVTKLCDFYCLQYPILNRDLLLTSALFHDLGKLDELSAFPENDYTDGGQLLGHIIIGTLKLDERMKTIPNFPVKLSNELKHCILSHHGELLYGSPKKPALIEAVALTHADNTDAKIQTFTEELMANEDKADWIGYNRFFESNLSHTSKPNIK